MFETLLPRIYVIACGILLIVLVLLHALAVSGSRKWHAAVKSQTLVLNSVAGRGSLHSQGTEPRLPVAHEDSTRPPQPLSPPVGCSQRNLPEIRWPFLQPPLLTAPRTDNVSFRLEDRVSILDANVDFDKLDFGLNFHSVRPLLVKLSQQKHLHIVTLGGSVPFGNNCEQTLPDGGTITYKACSWPARFASWLQAVFPEASVLHTNRAEGGVSLPVISNSIGSLLKIMESDDPPIDFMILDSSLNDIWRGDNDLISQSFEALVHTMHELSPQTVVMVMINHCASCTGHPLSFKNATMRIAKHYGLPLVDFEMVTRSRGQWKNGPIPGGGTDENHPSWHTHQRMADAVAMLWGREIQNACRDVSFGENSVDHAPFSKATFWPMSKLRRHQGCKVPLSLYNAHRPNGLLPTVMSGDWKLREDRRGKPGWIATSQGARIEFRVRFGPWPELFVTYLRSYEHIGSVLASLATTEVSEVVDGHWQTKASQADLAWLSGPEHRVFRKAVAPNSEYTLQLELLEASTRNATKFKVMQVISC